MASDGPSRRAVIGTLGTVPFLPQSAVAQGPAAVSSAGPLSVKNFGASGDGTADDTRAIQAAIDHIDRRGGGSLYLPAGIYLVSNVLRLSRNLTLVGDGQRASIIRHTGLTDCFRKVEAINAATPVHVSIRSIGIINTRGGENRGSGIRDTGGTYISISDVLVENFKYGITLDQSELVDIDLCTIQLQSHSCIWLVNGPDLVPGAAPGFTNRISVSRCQLNAAGQWAVLDDGGVAHSLRDNNYNGCGQGHVRAAGVLNLLISGGEFEGAGIHNLLLVSDRLSGGAVGGSGLVLVQNAAMIPRRGKSAVFIGSCGILKLDTVFFGNSNDKTVASVAGMTNANTVVEIGCGTENVGPMFDRPANGTSSTYLNSKQGMRKAAAPARGTGSHGDIIWNNHVNPANDRVDYWINKNGTWLPRP